MVTDVRKQEDENADGWMMMRVYFKSSPVGNLSMRSCSCKVNCEITIIKIMKLNVQGRSSRWGEVTSVYK